MGDKRVQQGPRSLVLLDPADAEAERFFAQGEAASADADSLAPSSREDDESERPVPVPVSPELRLRRARLRRMVAIGLGSGVAVLISGIGAARLSMSSGTRMALPPVEVPMREAPARAAPPRVHPVRAAGAMPSASPPPAPSTTLVVPSSSAALPRPWLREARTLLSAGRAREGVAAARAAIAADPSLAEAYVLLGAGLQDLGAWDEAYRTFATCAERTQSPACKYFARRAR